MDKILSQEEIKALFSAMSSGNSKRAASSGKSPVMETASYLEFQPSDLISPERMRSMHLLYEYFSRYFASSLSGYFRNQVSINLATVKQAAYPDLARMLPDPKLFARIGIRPLDGTLTLELSLSFAFTMVDSILGDPVQVILGNRSLTDFDLDILDAVLRIAVRELKNAWSPIVDLEFFLKGKGTQAQMFPDISSGEQVVMAHLVMKIGHISGMMLLCIPSRIINQLWSKLDSENVGSV